MDGSDFHALLGQLNVTPPRYRRCLQSSRDAAASDVNAAPTTISTTTGLLPMGNAADKTSVESRWLTSALLCQSCLHQAVYRIEQKPPQITAVSIRIFNVTFTEIGLQSHRRSHHRRIGRSFYYCESSAKNHS